MHVRHIYSMKYSATLAHNVDGFMYVTLYIVLPSHLGLYLHATIISLTLVKRLENFSGPCVHFFNQSSTTRERRALYFSCTLH